MISPGGGAGAPASSVCREEAHDGPGDLASVLALEARSPPPSSETRGLPASGVGFCDDQDLPSVLALEARGPPRFAPLGVTGSSAPHAASTALEGRGGSPPVLGGLLLRAKHRGDNSDGASFSGLGLSAKSTFRSCGAAALGRTPPGAPAQEPLAPPKEKASMVKLPSADMDDVEG